ncbi:MAG TPA: alkaline phosphatase family protein [Acidimicrobiales bacterium]
MTLAPILPAYGGACVDSVTPALLAPPGRRPDWLPAPAREAPQVVLLVLDGLGWHQLQERPVPAPALMGMVGGPITSVVPTTTATALTSIALGVDPAAHGVVGYRVRVAGPSGDEVLNVLRWRTSSGDARPFVPPTEFQPTPAFGGRSIPVVTRSEFLSSGFTAAHLGGSRHIGWMLPSAMVVEVARLVESGEPFVYAYYDGIDKIAHGHGFGPFYDAELRAADRLVGDLVARLPPGAVLVVTADHGQVEVGRALRILAPELMADTVMVSGEGRFRWLHAAPGRVDALAEGAHQRYDDEAWVWTTAELEDGGFFGGRLTATARSRVGDVAIVPQASVAYLDPSDQGDAMLICRHGSLTEAEMLVPLLASGG